MGETLPCEYEDDWEASWVAHPRSKQAPQPTTPQQPKRGKIEFGPEGSQVSWLPCASYIDLDGTRHVLVTSDVKSRTLEADTQLALESKGAEREMCADGRCSNPAVREERAWRINGPGLSGRQLLEEKFAICLDHTGGGFDQVHCDPELARR